MGITIGIDLGTTNSVVCAKKINVLAIRNAEGEELTPSCVTAVPNSKSAAFDLVVGRGAKDLLKQYPEQTITSVKRLMGRDFEDLEVQNIIKKNHVGYTITTEPSEPGSIRIPLGEKMHTPEMISGIILSKLLRDGEVELQGAIDQAVVTVPAYFSDRQKFVTRAACDYAGVKLLRLLPEPTAAALSFGLKELDNNAARTIMVFDLGGGTFDISVLSFAGGSFMEITKGGDMWLGGDNIDKLLVDHIFTCAAKAANCKPIIELIELLSPADKARFLVEVKEKAEAAKITLSSEELATVEIFGLLKDENNNLLDIDVTITRTEFASLINAIVRQTTAIATQILHEIRFEPELIDTVLMVGGSSLIPAIQEELKTMFGQEKVLIHPRPMLAVAEGAALLAATIINQDDLSAKPDFSIMHSTAHDYYLQLAGGKKHLLVARNTPLPVVVEEKLQFSHQEQSLARLRVLNEIDGVLDTVGELWFHKNRQWPPKLEKDNLTSLMLRFAVDENNIITMKAWPLEDKKQAIEAAIARGGLAAKLYNDLEHTLSAIIATNHSANLEEDVLDLSKYIVTTILAASDPITGETRVEAKLKAQRQIETLKICQEQNIAPLGKYEFAQMSQTAAAGIITSGEMARLTAIIDNFAIALENLDDGAKFKQLEEELEQFYDDVPIASELAEAENAALVIAVNDPSEARRIRAGMKALATAYASKQLEAIEKARHALYIMANENLSHGMPSGRFDRDVCL